MSQHPPSIDIDEGTKAAQAKRFGWRDALVRAPNISLLGKVVGQCLAMHYNVQTGACFPSEELLARELRKTPRTIAKAIAELKKNRWIEVWRPNRLTSNHYELLDTHVDAVIILYDDLRADLDQERERKRSSPRKTV
jgi:hypothetical protein